MAVPGGAKPKSSAGAWGGMYRDGCAVCQYLVACGVSVRTALALGRADGSLCEYMVHLRYRRLKKIGTDPSVGCSSGSRHETREGCACGLRLRARGRTQRGTTTTRTIGRAAGPMPCRLPPPTALRPESLYRVASKKCPAGFGGARGRSGTVHVARRLCLF